MTDRIFRLNQIHRKNDERLRFEGLRRAPHSGAISRLLRLKDRVKSLMADPMPLPA